MRAKGDVAQGIVAEAVDETAVVTTAAAITLRMNIGNSGLGTGTELQQCIAASSADKRPTRTVRTTRNQAIQTSDETSKRDRITQRATPSPSLRQ
jgi:hypothetical protein